MKKRVYSCLLILAMVLTMLPGGLLPTAAAGESYTTLATDQTLALSGETLWVDLSGHTLTVTGSGTVYAFDTANDTYDAEKCGKLIAPETVTVVTDVEAPNGNRYVAVTENGETSMHRLAMGLTTVTLRTDKAGLYYKAAYFCDSVLSSKVQAYGVVLSLSNMPGADFKTEMELYSNQYTVASAPFQSGAVCVSGSVFNIMKDTNSQQTNNSNGNSPIYANVYVDFGSGPLVADTKNPGKSLQDPEFDGTAYSLRTVMERLDDMYFTHMDGAARALADNFHAQWKDKGMDWDFVNIGSADALTVDNSNLVFDQGTDAVCPVCKEKVTWTAITKESGTVTLGGKHYYLTKDLTYTGTSDAGYISNGTANATACLHLNGHSITATQTRAIFGGAGRLNVMGNGTVTGYNKSAQGAAVQINNKTAGNGVYLYGGTYQKAANAHADAHTVAIWDNGTTLNIYGGAKIVASGNGAAVYSGKCSYADNTLGLYDCTIEGDVKLNGATQGNGKTSTVILNGATVTGTVEIPLYASGVVAGEAKINAIDIHEDSRLTVGVLSGDASIGIRAENVFTTSNAAVYRQYFKAVSPAAKITVDGTALRCGIDYTGKLQFVQGTDAVCPVCEKVVTWTALGTTNQVGTNGGHYYLSQSVEYTGSSSNYYYFRAPASGSCCVHLNGFDITASARPFYGNTGVLNVMGSGNVSGQNRNNFGTGATVQIATGDEDGAINLYSGTYRNSAAEAAASDVISVQDNGGAIFLGKDVTVEGNVSLGAAKKRSSALTIEGTVTGNVTAAGAASDVYTTTLILDNAVVQGTVDLNGTNTVKVVNAPKLSAVDMEANTRLTMERLKTGTSIGLKSRGVITEPHADAESYKQYFTTPHPTDKFEVVDGALVCKLNYTDNLQLTDGVGFCPVCNEDVQWEALPNDGWAVRFNNSGEDHTFAGTHYYLSKNVTYSGSSTAYMVNEVNGKTVCVHLNGCNITSTTRPAIFGSSGAINIMGTGTVSGYNNSGEANKGSAIFTNNGYTTNGLSLYSGTYTMQDNSVTSSVISLWAQGGRVYVYEDATVDAGSGLAIFTSTAAGRTNDLQVMGAAVKGDILTSANPTKTSTILLQDADITGTVTAAAGNSITFDGLAKVGKLSVPAGVTVNFTNMKEGSSVPVAATGAFTNALADDYWLDYFSIADKSNTTDWLILRDHAVNQTAKVTTAAASDSDKTTLDNAYAGRQPLHGEMHDHSKSGPKGDGKRTLAEIKTEMTRLSIDFTTLVDHKQSVHMYLTDWDDSLFVGGSEPGTSVSDSNGSGSFHFNMIFSDPEKLEEAFTFGGYTLKDYEDGEGKYFENYVGFTTASFTALAEKVYSLGGLLVHVHPKYNSYLVSDDPLDYYFGSENAPMGLEIHTGTSKRYNMVARDNEEAYQTWVDLLEAGKWVYATAGSDLHGLPNADALTSLYSAEKHADAYMELMRSGDFAPGWVGIRMTLGGVNMGGRTDFSGQKLVFSVGDIYTGDSVDAATRTPVYVADHTYRVELYDDSGILSQCVIDPTQTTYFSVDADENAKFYRIVVWDDTAKTRVGVSNPIWNTK